MRLTAQLRNVARPDWQERHNMKWNDLHGWLARFIELMVILVLWFVSIYIAVSLHYVPMGNDHLLCGPWGCGPATSALVAVHLGWFAILGPPLIYIPYRLAWSLSSIRILGAFVASCGMIGAAGIVAWQWLVWLPGAGEWSRPYIWHRCGFSIVTAIDWPLIQLVAIGAILRISYRKKFLAPKLV